MKKKSIIADLFSIRKSGIWKDFAHELNAEHIDRGFFREDRLIIEQNGWAILMDVYLSGFNLRIPYTRLTAICKEKRLFYFKIKSKNRTFFPYYGTVKTENESINAKYYIKSSNKYLAENLFNTKSIVQSLLDTEWLNLRYDKTGLFIDEGIIYPELQHTEMGYISDVERLKRTINLFIEILNYLDKYEIAEKLTYKP
jgi:hypothetical protein